MAEPAQEPAAEPGDPAEPSEPAQATEAVELTLAQAAARAGVSPGTVKRWLAMGLVPGYDGRWTPASVAYVRVVARLRARGHSLAEIKRASDAGQLAVGPIEELLGGSEGRYTLREVARETGLEAALIERILAAMGPAGSEPTPELLTDEDREMLRYVATMLEAGLPSVAFVQLARVYGQALAQVAEAEVRLIHLYVHEPLMREGIPNVEIAEEMEGLARELIPFAAPLLRYTHDRLLGYFVEQDVIGHMESELAERASEEGRVRVAIAFADLAGYARLTVERGDEAALAAVERFVERVEQTLPADARVIKTLGDEVMVVGPDVAGLVRWAVGLSALTHPGDPPPRIGMHYGEALYRDGDYYGREINQAARVVARAGGGEVLVTRPIVDVSAGVDGARFERIGEVRLKGFSDPTELFIASAASD
jgi:adenylate cyclase